ncbi:hypothetical protein ACFFRR_001862 [Megaselia abdita]
MSLKQILLLVAVCQIALALPSVRVKREEEEVGLGGAELNPIDTEESLTPLDREKRKLPDAHFAAKNAVLGFVFNKVDNLLDSKTRFVEALDRSNIEKNKEYNITAPVPIRDFQSLITAVVSPKILSVGSFLSSLTTGVLTGVTSLSGGSSGGGSGGNAGLGNVVSKFLSFSGPILQGSTGGSTTESPDSTEDTY